MHHMVATLTQLSAVLLLTIAALVAVCSLHPGARLPAEAVPQLGAVSEGEDWPEDGPDDGQHVGRHVDVGLEHRHPRVIHRVKQRGQPVPHREDGEGVPEK